MHCPDRLDPGARTNRGNKARVAPCQVRGTSRLARMSIPLLVHAVVERRQLADALDVRVGASLGCAHELVKHFFGAMDDLFRV